jgi:hypothetical protein
MNNLLFSKKYTIPARFTANAIFVAGGGRIQIQEDFNEDSNT